MRTEILYDLIFLSVVLFFIVIMAFRLLIPFLRYKQSSYYRVTHVPYWTMLRDTDALGEYETYRRLRTFEKHGAAFLFHLKP